METEVNKVEFYKVRTLGERFSAAGDFVRQNWKLLMRNLFFIGAPIAILLAYFSQGYTSRMMTAAISGNSPSDLSFVINGLMYLLLAFIFYLFIYSMTGAILHQAANGKLKEDAGWKDLKGDMFSIMGKLFIQGIILFALLFGVVMLVGLFLFTLGTGLANGKMIWLFAILFMLLVLVFLPPLAMVQYPIFFEKKSGWEAIPRGFTLGLKNWGSVFATVFLAGLLLSTVSYIFAAPSIIYSLVFPGGIFLISFIFSIISMLVSVIVYPIFILFIGFQYTSIVEKEEGVSLQDKVDDFDQL